MRITGFPGRRAGLIVAAAGLVAGTVLAVPAAQAAPAAAGGATLSAQQLSGLADTVSARLGARSAGSYLDQATGKLVVTVTTAADANAVRAMGATAKMVTRSGAQLAQTMGVLNASARIVGTSWAVDATTNQVLITADSTVTGAKMAKLRAVAKSLGAAVRIESTPGTLSTTIVGGDAIFGGSSRCSLGFNVRNSAGTQFFLTAGHCGNIASTWYANSSHTTVLGTVQSSSFPTNDYAIIRYTSTISRPGAVNLYNGTTRDITGSANAVLNQTVFRSGSTTHVHSGTVTGLNATVNYPQGTVFGMIRTTVCAEPGDSGGPLFAGNTALGITSGGSGNCSSGGTTFFQPVTEPLGVFGVSVY